MEFRTIIPLPSKVPPVTHEQKIMLMGSCFSENLGATLQGCKFQVDLNPFGILYNPASIATALQRILSGAPYTERELFQHQGLWHSRMHHGHFSALTAEETLQRINGRLEKAHQEIPVLDWLMITFGTSYVYREKESGEIVSNCHKLPERNFERSRLRVEEIVGCYTSLISTLRSHCPDLKILFTVSPIRHLRDGLHENQLSKSTLLLAIEQLQEAFPENVFYFPSYEIVVDELRDYRFYAEDMVHPSATAIQYLWERFSATFFPDETTKCIREVQQVEEALDHRPLKPESEEYRRFLENLLLKIEQLSKKYTYLDFQNELKLCRARLNISQN